MDEEKLSWLLDRGVSICTSLDGDKLTHNSQRVWKEGDSYDKTTYWIGRINEEMRKRGA
jgi:sulfatase maturation enzyme AslB (radical SAM superfamily)